MIVANPYTLNETLVRVIKYLDFTTNADAINLVNSAIERSKDDSLYAEQMEAAFCNGSTIQVRALFEVFGTYLEPPRGGFPPYPHRDAVNAIDSALYHVKLGHGPGYLRMH